MIKLLIKSMKGSNYILEGKEKIYNLNLELYDIEELPKENDYIYISEELLNNNYKEYDTYYRFGALDSKYGRVLKDENEEELLIVGIDNKKIYLKRLYG